MSRARRSGVWLAGLVLVGGAVCFLVLRSSSRGAEARSADGRRHFASEQPDRGRNGQAILPARDGRSPVSVPEPRVGGDLSPSLEVVVTSTRGAALEGARVELLDLDLRRGEETLLAEAVTDSEGLARLRTESSGALRLVASADGYEVSGRTLRRPLPERVTMVLDADGIVAGIVVDPAGEPIPGVRVVAWPTGYQPIAGRPLAARPDDRLLQTETNGYGLFSLGGLSRAGTYTLVAGSLGRAMPEPLERLQPGSLDLELTCAPVCAVRAVFRDGEAAPRCPAALSPSPEVRWSWPRESGVWLEDGDPRRQLAGMSPATSSRSLAPVFAFLSLGPEPFGPIDLEAALPGYEPVETRLTAPRFLGELAEVEIPLRATTSAWGVLIVDYGASQRGANPWGSLPEGGRLVLEHLATGQRSFVSYTKLPSGEHVLDSLPAGPYRVWFHPALHTLDHGEQGKEVEVRAGEPTRVELASDGMVDVELEVVRFGGNDWRGRVVVEISRLEDSVHGSAFYVLPAAPHVVPGLVPDGYSITIYEPFFDGPQAFFVGEEDAAAGRAHVAIVAP